MAQIQTLDDIDIRILRELQQNSRLTNKELAARIHLSTTPTFERHRRLEREGYIKMYTAIIDADRIDRSFAVYCNISFKQINREVADEFREIVSSWEEVTECYNVSGDCDFLMKVNVRGMKEYQEFILYKVGELDYVGRVQSVFVMETLKQNYGIRL
ncbi:MAG: Lrp/AsnC family transcriptional regulator [Bacteroidales bacterium]|jgi:Lrp/AsnC family leucine-responsive transcriptional regulator|nr:Lrp/AsnC family transcriptional regulator [Bacteroidales bacterium]MDO4524568.1 Lrp/AsnC family transcriptional regulator [Bacteroidales bacterium]MEE0084228.1 Lrp/AsnC family transcriptional regulator [Paludibacteraceae bacterium]MEE1260550.1 Lrp/AsnC family transcriptional regulator [Paludibacteraceae bacterium]